MKVIVAGYSKTGTKTMFAALTALGYKTYDTIEHVRYHRNDWLRILGEGGTPADFKRMYKGIDAVTDAPAFYFWKEILEVFPDSKVILTVREEEAWWRSFKKQFENLNANIALKIAFNLPFTMGLKYFRSLVGVIYGLHISGWTMNITSTNEMVARLKYRQHNSYVKHFAPAQKLLVYKVSEGWEPLCEFLGKDVPSIPYPRMNVQGQRIQQIIDESPLIIKLRQSFKLLAFILIGCGIFIAFVLAY